MRDQAFAAPPVHTRPAPRIQSLPFRIRVAESEADLQKAVALRAAAYSRHVPGTTFERPEPEDRRPDTVLLIAESKLDGSVLGSARLEDNAARPLSIEKEVRLPSRFQGSKLLEPRRLTVRNGTQGRMVTAALTKAIYEISLRTDTDYVLLAAREPVDQLYRAIQFENALGEGEKIHLSDVSNLPHGIYYMSVQTAAQQWQRANYPFYLFMALTRHPDIQIDYEQVHEKFGSHHDTSEEALQGLPVP